MCKLGELLAGGANPAGILFGAVRAIDVLRVGECKRQHMGSFHAVKKLCVAYAPAQDGLNKLSFDRIRYKHIRKLHG